MGIILSEKPKVIVQGITGNTGRFHTALMLQYGTNIVAGVTPGRGGEEVEGIPVFNTVSEASGKFNSDTSIMFVPANTAKDAVFEAISAGIKILVIITEGIPQKDAIQFINKANDIGDIIIIGPNSPGLIAPPHKINIGIMPDHIFNRGNVGIVFRSGTLTYEIAWHITNKGLGQSTCVGIGGDAIVGLDYIKILKMFKADEETKKVVLLGEIGGNAEELVAQYISETNYPKPVVAYIAGRSAPSGKRMGHAGAIIMGNTGTAESKINAFTAAGVPEAEKPSDVVKLLEI
ncbi:MAG: succinate--CoA ligase subunit alpha [Dehalococcoidales bacterium]|nr:succinate--CoA ligase subunit alpha [Dehalococcoidales bacterium]